MIMLSVYLKVITQYFTHISTTHPLSPVSLLSWLSHCSLRRGISRVSVGSRVASFSHPNPSHTGARVPACISWANQTNTLTQSSLSSPEMVWECSDRVWTWRTGWSGTGRPVAGRPSGQRSWTLSWSCWTSRPRYSSSSSTTSDMTSYAPWRFPVPTSGKAKTWIVFLVIDLRPSECSS